MCVNWEPHVAIWAPDSNFVPEARKMKRNRREYHTKSSDVSTTYTEHIYRATKHEVTEIVVAAAAAVRFVSLDYFMDQVCTGNSLNLLRIHWSERECAYVWVEKCVWDFYKNINFGNWIVYMRNTGNQPSEHTQHLYRLLWYRMCVCVSDCVERKLKRNRKQMITSMKIQQQNKKHTEGGWEKRMLVNDNRVRQKKEGELRDRGSEREKNVKTAVGK